MACSSPINDTVRANTQLPLLRRHGAAAAAPLHPLPSCRGQDRLPGQSFSACSLNQQLDRPRQILPEAEPLRGGGIPGQGNLPTTPLQSTGWRGGEMDELVAELSPAFPAFPRGAVTRHNVHSPNPGGAAGLRKLLRRDRKHSYCSPAAQCCWTEPASIDHNHGPELYQCTGLILWPTCC